MHHSVALLLQMTNHKNIHIYTGLFSDKSIIFQNKLTVTFCFILFLFMLDNENVFIDYVIFMNHGLKVEHFYVCNILINTVA